MTTRARVKSAPTAAADSPSKAASKRAPTRAGAGRKATPRRAAGARKGAGERLRDELTRNGDPYGLTVLITQASRIADRLETLDRVNSGSDPSWLRLDLGRVTVETGNARRQSMQVDVTLKMDDSIKEERAQSALLTKLLAEIHRQRAAIPMSTDEEPDDLDDFE